MSVETIQKRYKEKFRLPAKVNGHYTDHYHDSLIALIDSLEKKDVGESITVAMAEKNVYSEIRKPLEKLCKTLGIHNGFISDKEKLWAKGEPH